MENTSKYISREGFHDGEVDPLLTSGKAEPGFNSGKVKLKWKSSGCLKKLFHNEGLVLISALAALSFHSGSS